VPRFVRVGLRLERWFTDDIPWLPAGEVPATALQDLNARGNELSFFELAADVDTDRIVVAVVAKRQNPTATEVGSSLFELQEHEARALGITIARSPGETPDAGVNALHYHAGQLTARKLADLARVIAGGTLDSILPKRITEILQRGVNDGASIAACLTGRFSPRSRPLRGRPSDYAPHGYVGRIGKRA
jgi:hypothetical protein